MGAHTPSRPVFLFRGMAPTVLHLHVRHTQQRVDFTLTLPQDPWYPEVNSLSGTALQISHNVHSTGSAGLIQTIQAYSKPSLASAIVGTVATVGWVVQGVGLAFYYRQVCYRLLLDLFQCEPLFHRSGHITRQLVTPWKRCVILLSS